MYDIKLLEEEWEKYRKGKRRPYVLTVLAIMLIAAGAAAFYYMKEKGMINLESNTTKSIDPKGMVFVENRALTRLEVERPDVTEQPKEEEVSEVSTEIVEDLPLTENRKVSKRKRPRVKMNIITTEMPTVKKHVQKEEKPHERKYLAIKKISGNSAYDEVAERFRETQDTDDSLFLAKAYYNQGKYSKAAYWAFQTNNIDSGIEESVLIFVKAKVKLGHKNEAIRILSKYIKQTDSAEAKNLMRKIKKGKI